MRILILVIALVHLVHGLNRMKVAFQWKSIDFEFPNQRARDESIGRREFIPGNAVPLDVDVWLNGGDRKIFMTFPKFKNGIPATLATISNTRKHDSPLLTPYPSWEWQRSCEGLTSAFRTQIDKKGWLWVIDSGMVDMAISGRRECQPQLLAFDLKTNNLVYKHRFSNDLLTEGSILANLAVDSRSDNWQNVFVYVADVSSYALLVVDVNRNRTWKVQSNTMYPYPPYGVFTANNVEFDLMDGILGMALAPPTRNDRILYFHSLASVRESWVPTSVLKNERNFKSGLNSVPRKFETSQEARKSQSIAEAFDKNGILYFGMMDDNSLNCWNSDTSYKANNIHRLEQDDHALQFASGLKVITNEEGKEELWVMTDRFQLVMTTGMEPNEVNFRIVTGKLEDLLKDCPCRKYKAIVFPNKTDTDRYSHSKPQYTNMGYYGMHQDRYMFA